MERNDEKMFLTNKKYVIVITILLFFGIIFIIVQSNMKSQTVKMVMGGRLYTLRSEEDMEKPIRREENVEKYFRPSDLPVLNDRFVYSSAKFYEQYFQKEPSQIVFPKELTKSPEETIINYFSVLREAANRQEGKNAGCGTLGQSTTPYPAAYQFLSDGYKDKLSYEKYLASFQNILHTNLIKYKEIPVYHNQTGMIRYFVEIETIGGSENDTANFTYYYGFVDLINENGQIKIDDLKFIGENYLCAPYHGWAYDAESSVEVKYGGWCKLIKELYPTIQKEYVKHIYFSGTDGNEYLIEFFQLTNDTDIEIAQYRKNKKGAWELILLNPEECIKDHSGEN